MKIPADRQFRVQPGSRTHLKDFDPDYARKHGLTKKQIRSRLAKVLEKIDRLQERLYAEQKRGLLIVLQGMDTAGKDGVLRHVIRGMAPQGVTVTSFKKPTPEELRHDFLWRIEKRLPSEGQIGVFNRSHYEDIVTVRMRNIAPPEVWRGRYATVKQFEERISHPKGKQPPIKVIKIFLNISQQEQFNRLWERIQEKPWKLEEADFLSLDSWKKYTKIWNQYQTAWEETFRKTSTTDSPWYVVPANDKEACHLFVAEIIYKALKEFEIRPPEPKIDVKATKAKMKRMGRHANDRGD